MQIKSKSQFRKTKSGFKKRRCFIMVMLFFLFTASIASASQDLSIGRMRAALWPEYDDPGILVIYDGRFKDDSRFPAEAVFYIPKGAQISDACSLSPKGQHFCQLFKQKSAGDVDEVRLKLPFPNFYLSFHVNPFKEGVEGKAGTHLKDGWRSGEKTFDYIIKANHPIDKLEVDIQRPLRADDFRITPPSTEKREFKGFKHYDYVYENVEIGRELKFNVMYVKKDNLPSQDIKYSPMTGPKVFGSPYEERKFFSRAVITAGIVGFLVLLVMLALVFRKGRK